MNTHAEKAEQNKSKSVANDIPLKQGGNEAAFRFADNRPEAVAQRKLHKMAAKSPQAKQAAQLQAMADNYSLQQEQPILTEEDRTSTISMRKASPTTALNPASVVQLNREYGLNTEKQLGAYTESLFESMVGTEKTPPLYKVSTMMLSINARLTSLKYPPLTIVSKKGLPNDSNAHFDFKTWKMEIDESRLVINKDLANALYHEARHSEQWFKMIILEIVAGKKEGTITGNMGVPLDIVQYANTLNPVEIVPLSERPSVLTFYESVYGSGKTHRTSVIKNIRAEGNYAKYRLLPEEVDAWEVGGKVTETMLMKIEFLKTKIMETENFQSIREMLSRLDFYTKLFDANSKEVKKLLKVKLGTWADRVEELRKKHSDETGENLEEYIRIVDNYNKLAGQAELEKLKVVDQQKVITDTDTMLKNLATAKKKLREDTLQTGSENWVVKKLVDYINDCISQYYAEIIKPEPNSANWAVGATGRFLSDIDQAILEAKQGL